MTQGATVENLIRSTLKSAVLAEEPAAAVRASLLAAAEHENVLRSAIGPAIPLLAEDLQERRDPSFDLQEQVMTSIPLARRQLLLIAAPLYAVR